MDTMQQRTEPKISKVTQRTVQIGKYTVNEIFLGKKPMQECLEDLLKSYIRLDSN